ncbi:hypothetical protein GF362_01535 [Candidatus Dojkabacteria bacterium]|nr:hypothetical protein [Candidatus Dojkabacteria bacterium]
MNLEFLANTLALTSTPREEIAQYVAEYSKTVSLCAFEAVMGELDQMEDNEKLGDLVNLVGELHQHKTSLDIADEEKTKAFYDRFEVLMNSVMELPEAERIKERIEEEIDALDQEVVDEIIAKCTEEDRERILEATQAVLQATEE